LRTQQAAVESAKAMLGTAQEQFGYADLKTGVAGIVTTRSAETGQVVQAGQTIFTVAQDGPRDAVFQVYEALLTDPPASKTVDVVLQSDPRVKATGAVREISPTVDASSGTVKVKVGLDSVPPGMSLGASVIGSGDFKPRQAIVLPRAALFRWDDAPAIWMFDPKTRAVTPRVVTIERYAGDTLVLSGGVAPGDSVVTAGIQFLHPGQVVAVQEKRP
jgi:RND family efflux transporter MFP subunit